MNPYLVHAIRAKQMVEFRYRDRVRRVEPYCYGLDARGSQTLEAYDVQLKAWEVFHVAEMQNLRVAADTGFKPWQDCNASVTKPKSVLTEYIRRGP